MQLKVSHTRTRAYAHTHTQTRILLIDQMLAEPPMPRTTATSVPSQAGIPLRVRPHQVPQVAPPNLGVVQWRLLLLRGSQYLVDGAIGQKDPD